MSFFLFKTDIWSWEHAFPLCCPRNSARDLYYSYPWRGGPARRLYPPAADKEFPSVLSLHPCSFPTDLDGRGRALLYSFLLASFPHLWIFSLKALLSICLVMTVCTFILIVNLTWMAKALHSWYLTSELCFIILGFILGYYFGKW